jgi:23S rRNA (guanosine2251-2'-O)-methyltransferase
MRSELVYGIHVIRHLLKTNPDRILDLELSFDRQDKRILDLKNDAEQHGIAVHPLSKKTLASLEENSVHQQAVARVRPLPSMNENDLIDLLQNSKELPLFLVLEHVQDPHNLGACLRTADAAGVLAVIIPKTRSAHLTPLVRKVACGAAETVPCIEVTNLVRCLEDLKQHGIWIIGTMGEAQQSVYETDLRVPMAFVMGGEEKGLRRLTAEVCDTLVKIPMLGSVESLNVSVSSAICLFEALRQRGAKEKWLQG